MEWFAFLSDVSNTLEPYVTLIIFSLWLSYFFKRENRLLARISILESVLGFLVVIIVIGMYKVNFIAQDTYSFYTFLSAVGILWGTQGLIWGLVFYLIPIEKILKIRKRGRKKRSSYF